MKKLDKHVFLLFGATGDLAKRLVLPALFEISQQPQAEGRFVVLGVARSLHDDAEFRREVVAGMVELAGVKKGAAQQWAKTHLFYQCLGDVNLSDYQRVRERADELAREHGLGANRIHYLALPPAVFDDTLVKLDEVGLCCPPKGWSRVVVEKPFGHDLESAVALNKVVHRYFREDQVYRIDHFLGKETVQNLLVFRFGNAIFERLWNRDHIARVEITVPEQVTVGTRAGYYDTSGALRDMVQNHLTQLLTLVAMEAPATTGADDIRSEKAKVLRSILPIEGENVVFGQYTAGTIGGEKVAAYVDAPGVAKGSRTETYVALRLQLENWRWQGVPFVLMTGKAMPRKLTRIRIVFRRAPVALFRGFDRCSLSANVLNITISPDEGFSLFFDVKRPGNGFEVDTQKFSFDYAETFGKSPGAYRTLLEDVMRGDRTLFVDADEVEASWALFDPILKANHTLHPYPAGTWGPEEARRLLNATDDD